MREVFFRLADSNEALATFCESRLWLNPRGRLWIVDSQGRGVIANLTAEGSWPKHHRRIEGGGTQAQAIAQLIRYVRDLPRLPLDTWRYWAGPVVQLCNEKTLGILTASDYGNKEKTRCILCGRHDYASTGLDWWSLDGVIGPCCSWRRGCRQESAPATGKQRAGRLG